MRLVFLVLVSSCLFGKIVVVPDYDGYVDCLFPKTLDRSYWDYGLWGKVKCVLTDINVEVSAASLETLAKSDLSNVEKIVVMNYPGESKLHLLDKLPKEKLILLVFEPPSVYEKLHADEYMDYFSCVMTWDDGLVDGEKYVKFHYPVMYRMKDEIVSFEEKRYLCMIARNKRSSYIDEIYSLRREGIEFFDGFEDFDLYGYDWQREGYQSYRGSIPSKYEVLRNYRFSLCFENTQNIEGYITEKIFDCFHVGCVPIYLGASNVSDYIPVNCFIDMRNFTSFEMLNSYLKNMGKEVYQEYINNIRDFLQTSAAKKYTDEQFVSDFCEVIER
ncbi:MAG: hypothetical protein SP1CHLAM54_08110 [Chlamydiia bacterium]|nr:hypothetical protein [Chlamydiia bacterium]MCH9615717.1 hypothetical protein [Chlamydiia bacterium]MCH9628880.1 hypothetical protein [Chlamydiia bacterium]